MDLGRVLGEYGGGDEMGGRRSDWGGKGRRWEWRRIGCALGTGKRAEVGRKLEFPRGAILAVRNGLAYRLSGRQRLREARMISSRPTKYCFGAWKRVAYFGPILHFTALCSNRFEGPRRIFVFRLGPE